MNRTKFIAGVISVFSLCNFSRFHLEAQEINADQQRKSVVSYLAKKDMPKSVNVDLHLRANFRAELPQEGSGKNQASFHFDHIMIGLHGNITKKLSYLYRQRLNKGGVKAFEVENLRSTIDYAYLTYKINDLYAVKVGRQALFMGGFEYYQSPIDVYEFSGIDNNITCYLTGASFMFTPRENQEFGVQIVNNRHGSIEEAFGAIPAGVEGPGAPLYYAVEWNSHYFDKKLELRYGAAAGEMLKGKWGFMINGGQKLNLGKFNTFLDVLYDHSGVDYLGMIRGMARTEEGMPYAGIAQSVQYLSVISESNYRFLPNWNIRVKAFYDHGSVFKSNGMFEKGTYISAWGYQGGIEYYPMADDNLRVYVNVIGKAHKDFHLANMETPRDRVRLSLGFVYRLPVL